MNKLFKTLEGIDNGNAEQSYQRLEVAKQPQQEDTGISSSGWSLERGQTKE